jgi:hypothetical protein
MSTIKPTMKDKVLDFVESQPGGQARFTDIQRFVYDRNYGTGAYEAARVGNTVNPNRGYYSGAFCKALSKWPWSNKKLGYFITGSNRLVKNSNGLYSVHRIYND